MTEHDRPQFRAGQGRKSMNDNSNRKSAVELEHEDLCCGGAEFERDSAVESLRDAAYHHFDNAAELYLDGDFAEARIAMNVGHHLNVEALRIERVDGVVEDDGAGLFELFKSFQESMAA
jgi:hypothetical protein